MLGGMSEYVWVELAAAEYEAAEAWGVVVDERLDFVVVRPESGRDSGAPWELHAVLHLDTDGFAGLEHIDGYPTLGAGKAAAESAVQEMLSGRA